MLVCTNLFGERPYIDRRTRRHPRWLTWAFARPRRVCFHGELEATECVFCDRLADGGVRVLLHTAEEWERIVGPLPSIGDIEEVCSVSPSMRTGRPFRVCESHPPSRRYVRVQQQSRRRAKFGCRDCDRLSAEAGMEIR